MKKNISGIPLECEGFQLMTLKQQFSTAAASIVCAIILVKNLLNDNHAAKARYYIYKPKVYYPYTLYIENENESKIKPIYCLRVMDFFPNLES